jgi:hypothetical protein
MSSTRRAFVIMPFGGKKAANGVVIDFDAVYRELLAPTITATGLTPYRADADRRGGSIHVDICQHLFLPQTARNRPSPRGMEGLCPVAGARDVSPRPAGMHRLASQRESARLQIKSVLILQQRAGDG